jgi:hypothetical protein
MTRTGLLATVIALATTLAAAQKPAPAPAPAGHWVGTIEAGPGIAVEVDLAPQPPDAWRGTISIPSQGTKGIPLAELTAKDGKVAFAIKGGMGDPRFAGQLSPDGQTISGTFSQGGGSIPLTLTWKGDAQFEPAPKNPAVSKELAGTWEGTLDVKGTMLRLVLTLANGPGGASGTLVSVDQNNIEIPVATIAEAAPRVTLGVPMIGGRFEGEVKGGELAGTWTQGPLTLPLVFKRRP